MQLYWLYYNIIAVNSNFVIGKDIDRAPVVSTSSHNIIIVSSD